ncbi:MAG: hypothetical protein ACI9ST_000886 [Psychrobacter glaciei]|jgi:uncharacterized protein with ParB-like and HNH nuclease domain|uniref:DUF262 domain-containing protein n=1 Tax=Psychrobacter glaciei TaxID=619771 RepID=UPI0039E688BD
MKIDADVLSIGDLEQYYFVVPDYQREYVWEADKHIQQFLVDIDEEFDAHLNEQQNYFIGSIIIVAKNSKYDVIDGQQRLTTIVLCLCAMRNLLEDLEDNQQLTAVSSSILNIIKNWLYKFDLKTKTTLPRLELQYEESNGYLDTIILKTEYEGEVTSSIRKMQEAYALISKHFHSYIQQSVELFDDYVQYFLTNVNVVVIESDNLGSALKIFETINQRGASLNAMDLVKNLLFSKATPKQFETIKTKWKEITTNLQECGDGNRPLRFLRYFMLARYHNGMLAEDDLYSWIVSKDGKQKLKYEANPLNLVKEMALSSKRYSHLVQATNGDKNKAGFRMYPSVVNIGYMNKKGSRQHLILLMALDSNCDDAIEYLARQLESFLFFTNTINLQPKNYIRQFVDWASEIREKREVEDIAVLVNKRIAPFLRPYLSDFKSTFMEIEHQDYNPQYRVRYLLGCLDSKVYQRAGLNPLDQESIQKLQIEHILPQKLTNSDASEDFSNEEDHEKYVNRLGNTTLLEGQINQAINSFNDMSSNWFELKQGEYINSSSILTKLLNPTYAIGKNTALNRFRDKTDYQFSDWTKNSIEKRQKILMELALDHWRFNEKRLDEYDRLNAEDLILATT